MSPYWCWPPSGPGLSGLTSRVFRESIPTDTDRDIDDELRRIRHTPDEVLIADLAEGFGGREPAALRVPDLPDQICDLLTWIWDEAVRPDWSRRARAFEADIVARTRQHVRLLT